MARRHWDVEQAQQSGRRTDDVRNRVDDTHGRGCHSSAASTTTFRPAERHLAVDVRVSERGHSGATSRGRGNGGHGDASPQRRAYVVAAEPGLLSSVDLPLTIPRNAFVTQLGVGAGPEFVTLLRDADQEQSIGPLRDVIQKLPAVGVFFLDARHRR